MSTAEGAEPLAAALAARDHGDELARRILAQRIGTTEGMADGVSLGVVSRPS